MPARARLEQLVEWVLPVAEELGAAAWLAVPERNAAERQIARHEEGGDRSAGDLSREQVVETRTSGRRARLSAATCGRRTAVSGDKSPASRRRESGAD